MEYLRQRCAEDGIDNVTPVCADASDLTRIAPVDFIFGQMILHHIEPFAPFVQGLRATLKPGGRGFFWENNAASSLLIWFRQNVVGKLWIRKEGDPDEFPLTPQEVGILRDHFAVRQVYPQMVFLQLIPRYLFRGKLRAPFRLMDQFLFRRGWLLHYSYRQFLLLQG